MKKNKGQWVFALAAKRSTYTLPIAPISEPPSMDATAIPSQEVLPWRAGVPPMFIYETTVVLSVLIRTCWPVGT